MTATILYRFHGQDFEQETTVEEFTTAIVPVHAAAIATVKIAVHDVQGLSALPLVTLQGFPLLRAVAFRVLCDLGGDKEKHVYLAREFERLVLSLPQTARLDALVLEGFFSRTLLNCGWARSPVVKALRSPLHSFACRLTSLIDRGAQIAALTVMPAAPAVSHTEPEQARIAHCLAALEYRDKLRF